MQLFEFHRSEVTLVPPKFLKQLFDIPKAQAKFAG